MEKILFYISEPWEREQIEASGLSQKATLSFIDGPLDADHLPDARDATILSVFVNSRITKEVIDAFPSLRLIATRSTGFDHIDQAACAARSIAIQNVPGYGSNTVAEHAFGLLLALSKRICDGWEQTRERTDFNPTRLRGFDLYEKTLGVIGTGRIGKHAVKIGKGFGMKVIAYDAFADQAFAAAEGITYLPLPELLTQADVLTIHVPYIPETHHLINRDNIGTIKRGAVLINTSRGAVVDTEALVVGLTSGVLRGVGLDVLEEEDALKDEAQLLASGKAGEHNLKVLLANHVLVDMQNVIVTPHSAFNTVEALARIVQTTIENIDGYLAGTAQNIVK